MKIHLLGSGAGGGVPQWNCGCANCEEAREGRRVRPRRQESVALGDAAGGWYLLNVSPEIRAQIEDFAPLHPHGLRHSPITAVVLTNGDLDHCLGLFSLRESQPLMVYATERVWVGLASNTMLRTLHRFPGQLSWRRLSLGEAVPLAAREGARGELEITALPAPGLPPLHLRGAVPPHPEDNVALRIVDRRSGGVALYAPAVASVGPLEGALAGAGCVLFDGTFYYDDELTRIGLPGSRATELGHLPVGGPGGSLGALAGLRAARRIYTHLNNTNPLLREDSPERRWAEDSGWEIAADGLEIEL
jgi:pyrroloquinoline quinone biosynthesis protein B